MASLSVGVQIESVLRKALPSAQLDIFATVIMCALRPPSVCCAPVSAVHAARCMCSTLDFRVHSGGGETYFPLVGGTDAFDRTWLPRHNESDRVETELAWDGIQR